jgi:hypothetical protein
LKLNKITEFFEFYNEEDKKFNNIIYKLKMFNNSNIEDKYNDLSVFLWEST